MKTIFRFLAGVFLGLLLLFALLIAVETFSAVVHPFPEGFQGTEEEICAHVARYPAWVLAAVVPMWAATALVSVRVAGAIGGRFSALTVGLLLNAALVCNLAMLPYPLWFKGASLLAILFATAAAVWITMGSSQTSTVKNHRQVAEKQD
ncbi:hypothetical protein LOC68_00160 [Blastopirellula sp. JC732]|uniref:Uncharacterized protein n=1 Tax=Blastopirellula sediminis TaxID=2894196 RepID=A0A9X1MIK1_9BACT|nr:hypothetical protein [Blastopirellula sediminis]MCC9604285.1 hypothetical protein [Blastopirellula sediminis]MCC9626805.1 hypothetical protein [Blastopirellula sediminis]